MSPKSEGDAINELESLFSELTDDDARVRVVEWAWRRYVSKSTPSVVDKGTDTEKPIRKKRKSSSKSRQSLSIVKELNLNPEGKTSFGDFVEIHKPSSNSDKCVVAVYYLHNELEIPNITINHVFTCYRHMKWEIVNIYNVLAKTASEKGLLNTSDMENITITPNGEHFVESELPKKTVRK